MRFTKIPADTFDTIQLNAGIIVDDFTPSTGAIGNLLGATTGGSTFAVSNSYTDFASDIDNAAKNMMEFKRTDTTEAKLSGTFATITSDLATILVASGDLSGRTYTLTSDTAIVTGKTYYTRSGTEGSYVYTKVDSPVAGSISSYYERDKSVEKITPRKDLKLSDFKDIWWLGDYSSENGTTHGGFMAIHLMNALSTGGFQLKSGDKAKGQFGYEFTAHGTNTDPDKIPYEIYMKQGTAESTT